MHESIVCLIDENVQAKEEDLLKLLESKYSLKLHRKLKKVSSNNQATAFWYQLANKANCSTLENHEEKNNLEESKSRDESKLNEIGNFDEELTEEAENFIMAIGNHPGDLLVFLLRGENAIKQVEKAFSSDNEILGMRSETEDRALLSWIYPKDELEFRCYMNFFCTPPSLTSLGLGDKKSLALTLSKARDISKPNRVHLQNLMEFLFPGSEQHPWATGRLLLFGEYGPLDQNGCLRGGIQSEHAISRSEIREMIRQIDRTDLLYIYVGNRILSPDEEIDVLSQVDPKLRQDKQITKKQFLSLVEHLPRAQDGTIDFHDIQQVIFKFREDRIKRWKLLSSNSLDRTARKSKDQIAADRRHTEAQRKASEDMLRKQGKVDDRDTFLATAKLLDQHTFEIGTLESQNDPSYIQNVRLLKNYDTDGRKYGATPWRS